MRQLYPSSATDEVSGIVLESDESKFTRCDEGDISFDFCSSSKDYLSKARARKMNTGIVT